MGEKVITLNRKAYHDYLILESVEAGLVLTGTEIKSIRAGRINLRDAYARPDNKELWLLNAHISVYESGNRYNHDPLRERKLLLHRKEIRELLRKVSEKGLTLVPLKLYLKNGIAKIELGLAKGKKVYDKRESIARKDADRELQRTLKQERYR